MAVESPSAEAPGSVLTAASQTTDLGRLRAHRAEGAKAGLNRLRNAAARRNMKALADALETEEGRAFFSFLFGNSPHLTGLLLRDLECAAALVTQQPDAFAEQVRSELAAADPTMPRDELMRLLRVQRNRVAVIAAVYDCFGIWDVMRCAELLADMADHALRLAVSHLLAQSVARGDLEQPDGDRWGYFVLAMGKHGSRELNYSSDIDLIALYDPERVRYQGGKNLREHCTRLTRDLVTILETRDAGGYVFRMDLRLRPDAASTPVAITTSFAADYYHSKGRTWERAAMIKARPVAGDLEAGEQFLERLAPFIWEEGLDFRSVEEIRAISEQIHDFHGHGAVKLAGQNVKLGRGGIREIEFFVHMHQLAYGGRNRRLRGRQVLPMLELLVDEHYLMPREASVLRDAYLLLRRVEHRLQMVNDNQTQTLPETDAGLEHIAAFLHLSSREELGTLLGPVSVDVHALYRARFNVPEREQDIAEAILTGPEGSPDALERLQAAGFQQAQTAFDTCRGWAEGRHPSTASERGREAVRALLHDIVEALGKTPDPDRALQRFDGFMAALRQDTALWSMLRANAWLLDLIAVVMGGAPRIADRLAGKPDLLQAVLDPAFFLPIPERDALLEEVEERLGGESNFRRCVDRVAAWADDRRFQVGVQTLQNLITLNEASASRAHIAEVAIEVLLRTALADLAERHGAPSGGCAVVALDDLGTGDMVYASPLNLVLATVLQDGRRLTGGPVPITEERFHARAAKRLTAALRRRTSAGNHLHDAVSLAVLPHDGPLHSGAWPMPGAEDWPQTHRLLALARARVLCGDPAAVQQLCSAIRQSLAALPDAGLLRRDLAALRRRLVADQPAADPFDFQHVRGGLVDLELLARHLQLLGGGGRETAPGNAAACFNAFAEAGGMTPDEAQFLAAAAQLQRSVQAFLRLTWSGPASVRDAPQTLHGRLANTFECANFDELDTKLRQTQQQTAAIFQRRIG